MTLPRLDNRAIRDEYERRFARAPGRVPSDDAFLRLLLRFLPESRQISLLDAGCGFGRYSRALVARGYAKVHGVDLFEQVPAGGFAYTQGEIANLPFSDATFDFVLCHSVIYYLPAPLAGIAELTRILRPGGRLIITGHTQLSWATLVRRVKRPLGKAPHLSGVRFFGTSTYRRWLQQSGADVIWSDGFSARRLGRLLDRLGGSGLAGLRSHFAYHFVLVADRRSQ